MTNKPNKPNKERKNTADILNTHALTKLMRNAREVMRKKKINHLTLNMTETRNLNDESENITCKKDSGGDTYPMIICVMGTSGSGKTSLVTEAMKELNYSRVVTTTSREPRNGEKDGVDYHFISPSEIMTTEFVECDMYHGNIYGTQPSDIEEAMRNNDCAFEIVTWNGYENISEDYKSVPVIVENRDFEAIRSRMQKRGDNPKNIEERMNGIRAEADFLHECPAFHYDNSGAFEPKRFAENIRNLVALMRTRDRSFDYLPPTLTASERKTFSGMCAAFERSIMTGDMNNVLKYCLEHSTDEICSHVLDDLQNAKSKDAKLTRNREHDIEM